MSRKLPFYLTIAFVIISISTGRAQNGWSTGTITLTDGSIKSGSVKYDDVKALLYFKDDSGKRNCSPIELLSFEFFDSELRKTRQFYSLLYRDPAVNAERPVFFELLHQSKEFALLSKLEPLENDVRFLSAPSGNDGRPGLPQSKSITTQLEIIFFADQTGAFKPYLEITFKSDRIFKRTRGKVVNDGLFSEYTRPYYDSLVSFSAKKKLDFDNKEDLVLILDHYKTLCERYGK